MLVLLDFLNLSVPIQWSVLRSTGIDKLSPHEIVQAMPVITEGDERDEVVPRRDKLSI